MAEKPKQEKKKGLTSKQKAFVNAYLSTYNATEAARQAHYKGDDATLASVGWENLRKPEISKAISERLSAQAMMADEVLNRLADQARSSMNDFVRIRENGDPTFDFQSAAAFGKMHLVKKLKIKTRTYTSVEVVQRQANQSESDEIEDGDQANTGDGIDIGGVVETTVEFELYSSQAALELIGKHHKLFTDKIEHSGPDGKPIPISIVKMPVDEL